MAPLSLWRYWLGSIPQRESGASNSWRSMSIAWGMLGSYSKSGLICCSALSLILTLLHFQHDHVRVRRSGHHGTRNVNRPLRMCISLAVCRGGQWSFKYSTAVYWRKRCMDTATDDLIQDMQYRGYQACVRILI